MVTAEGESQPNPNGEAEGRMPWPHSAPGLFGKPPSPPPQPTPATLPGLDLPCLPTCALQVGAIDWGLSSCAKHPSLGNRKIPAEETVGTLGLGPPVPTLTTPGLSLEGMAGIPTPLPQHPPPIHPYTHLRDPLHSLLPPRVFGSNIALRHQAQSLTDWLLGEEAYGET
jgi:hypothetical protein